MEYLMLVIDEDDDGEAWEPVAADFEAWVAGYDILEAATLEEAIEVASRHPRARTGRIELYPTIPLDFPNPQH